MFASEAHLPYDRIGDLPVGRFFDAIRHFDRLIAEQDKRAG